MTANPITQRLARDGGPKAVRQPLDFYKGGSMIGEEETASVLEVLRAQSLFRYSGPHLLGKVAAFEQSFAQHLGSRFALACNSGTSALRLALIGLGIGPGDEVIVPALTFIATANAVVAQGATPIFGDVDDFLSLDPEDLSRRITSRTKAIIPVHLFGVACEMEKILAIARANHLAVVEDAAQAIGNRYRGRCLGTFADAGAFSFQQGKNITAGEGGAIVTDNEEFFCRAVKYHDQGGQFPIQRSGMRDTMGGTPFLGENLRMNELSGAVLGAQLRKLEGIVANIASVRRRVHDGLRALNLAIAEDPERTVESSAITFLVPKGKRATEIAHALAAEGVLADNVYGARPVYSLPQMREKRMVRRGCPFSCPQNGTADYPDGLCPKAEDLSARTVVVYIGPWFNDEAIEDIVHATVKVVQALF